jgi:hypothetical protein
MNDQGIRASALVAVELHLKNEIEMKRLLGKESLLDFLLKEDRKKDPI